MKSTVLPLLLLTLSSPALAEDAPKPAESKPAESKPGAVPDTLKDRYGFNMLSSPSKEKCVRVDAKLLKELKKNYECAAENTDSASGAPAVVCTRKDEKKSYAFFKTRAQCNEDRETQAANGEEE